MNTTYTLSMDFEYDKIVSANTVGYGIVITGEENENELLSYVLNIINSCSRTKSSTLEKIYFTLFKNSDEILLEDVDVPNTIKVRTFISDSLIKIKDDKDQFIIEEVVEENESDGRETG